uniref:BHLH domain-containing protein n=1 Tax=Graphocephala atropunctata TaxID=36148 RepID=A0A1B6LYF6_9HEMI
MDIIDPLDTSDEKDVDSDLLGKELVSATPLTIVEEDASLSPDNSGTIPQSLLDNDDEEITYQLRSAEGVTYRVVSVGAEDLSDALPQLVSTNGTSFSNSSSPPPGVQALLTNSVNGQLYVIGSHQEVFGQQNQRNIVPRVPPPQSIQLESVRGGSSSSLCRPRDDRRRATHNEVERRRRDKINNWITRLSKIIPDCSQDTGKGSFETQSKGGILAKACDYILELRSCNQRLLDFSKENEQLAAEMEELRNENNQLRAQLAEHGISPCHDSLSIT